MHQVHVYLDETIKQIGIIGNDNYYENKIRIMGKVFLRSASAEGIIGQVLSILGSGLGRR